MRQLRADLATGFALLSRLPVGRWLVAGTEMDFARAVWEIYLGPNNLGESIKKGLVSRL